MQLDNVSRKTFSIFLFVCIFSLLYLILKVVVLAITLYIAGFVDSLNGTSIEAFQASATHALLIDGDYILALLLAAYIAWRIVKRAFKA